MCAFSPENGERGEVPCCTSTFTLNMTLIIIAVTQVLRRENTCFMSGTPAVVRKPATCIRMFASDKIENLDIAPIFTREVSDPMRFLPEGVSGSRSIWIVSMLTLFT